MIYLHFLLTTLTGALMYVTAFLLFCGLMGVLAWVCGWLNDFIPKPPKWLVNFLTLVWKFILISLGVIFVVVACYSTGTLVL